MQRHAVIPAAVRAALTQAREPALQGRELSYLVADRDELRLGGSRDVARGPRLGRAEQVAKLGEREAESPRPPDDREPPLVCLGVFAESRAPAFRQREQSPALVEPDCLHADARVGRELPDGQTVHVVKLAAVPRYGVKSAWRPAVRRRCRRPLAARSSWSLLA